MTTSFNRALPFVTPLLAIAVASAPVVGTAAAPEVSSWQSGTAGTLKGKTHVDRAIGKCVLSVVGGAILGGLIGAAAGSTKKGALIGGAAGVGLCAILMKVASDKDKAYVRQAQLDAANLGQYQTRSWRGSEGDLIQTAVSPSAPVPVVIGEKGSYRCRTDNMCLVGDQWVAYDTLVPQTAPGVQLASSKLKVIKCRRLQTDMAVNGQGAASGSEAVCLVGDSWVTGDQLKKMNIRDADVVTI